MKNAAALIVGLGVLYLLHSKQTPAPVVAAPAVQYPVTNRPPLTNQPPVNNLPPVNDVPIYGGGFDVEMPRFEPVLYDYPQLIIVDTWGWPSGGSGTYRDEYPLPPGVITANNDEEVIHAGNGYFFYPDEL